MFRERPTIHDVVVTMFLRLLWSIFRGGRFAVRNVLLVLMCCLTFPASAQDLQIPNSPYDAADDATKERKAFLRERWFYEQRMYPFNRLPDDAYGRAMKQRDELRRTRGFRDNSVMWTNLGPTPGYYFSYGDVSGRTATVKYDPNNPTIIYIGAAFGGVWKTTNAGATWSAKTDFEATLASGALAVDRTNSNIIYYGTGEATYSSVSYYGRGLLKSTDGGNTWTHYTNGLEPYTYFSRIVIRPNNSNHLLAALGNRSSPSATGGIYLSTNGGLSWTAVVSGRADDVVFSPSGDTAYAVGSGVGYRISTNGGQSFTTSSALTMQTRNHIAIALSNPSILYAATYSGSTISVFKSTNAGISFTQVAVGTNFNAVQAWYDFYIHVNPFDPNYVYVGSIDMWRSTNGGASFQNITNGYAGGNVHVDQHNVDFHPTDSNQMVCVNDGGVWRSTDRGTTWTNLNSSLTLTQFYRITADPSNAAHILGGTQDNGTQRTTGAMNWAAAFGGDGGEVCFHSQNPSLILGETQYNGIYRSTNGGATWSSSTSGLSGTAAWIAPILSHPDSANIFYTARQSVFKSTNGGASWFSISSGISGTIREMAISKSDPQIMFATIASSVYRSTNRGYNWTNVTSGLPNRTITTVTVHPDSSNIVLLSFSGFGAGKVYRSTNTGTTWTNISGNLPDTPVNDVLIYYPTPGTYLAATDVGVFITNNYGTTWTELADGLPNTVAMHLDYHAATGKLRVGTHGRGVYETTLAQATIAVITPNGGETWPIGTSQTIQWNSSFVTGNVKIELSRNGGTTFSEVLFASTANDGAETWMVTGPATSQARVRISSVSNPGVADTSSGNFSIVQPAISVLVPNGGETWPIGTSQMIEWGSSFVTGNVKIELSRNGGTSYETLFASTANDGVETWMVTGPATSQARVRISSVSNPGVADTSSGNFSIVQPAISVLVPNGGETWLIGTSQMIEWGSSFVTGNVKIELSRNGGTSYETLFASTANDGIEPWEVTPPLTANALIRVSSVSMPTVMDVSNAPFSISVHFTVFVTLRLRDNGGQRDSLEFGTAPGATDGIDYVFGEYELPPVPPIGVFDVRWLIAGIEGMKRDIRDTLGGTRQQVIYTGRLQTGDGGFPFHLRWNRLELPDSGSFTLRNIWGDTAIVVNMRQQDSAVIGGAFQIVYNLRTTVNTVMQQGWNLVSVPVTVGDLRKGEVFPTSTSSAFWYTPAGYVIRDTLDYGVGYWLKFGTGQTVSVTGGERLVDTVEVVAGWNMIGSISGAVAVGSIVQVPSGIVVSPYFGYGSTGYSASTTIEPMKGYWVKVNQNGKLVLVSNPPPIMLPRRNSAGID